MNIDGLGENIIEDLFNMEIIKDIVDIYDLKHSRDKLIELEGFGEKSVNKLLDSIEESKKNSLERVLFAFGIKGVGEKVAKILAKQYKSVDNLMLSEKEEIESIRDLGPILADSIYEFFHKEANIKMIESLKEKGLNFNYIGEEIKENDNFKAKKFVLTGTLQNYKRDDLSSIIEALGGEVVKSVSKNTDVVIAGESAGSKLDKARALNIEIWDEEKLLEMLK